MEAYARAPDPLTSGSNMTDIWLSWKDDFLIFMRLTGYIDKANEIRANLLKNRIGKVGMDAIQKITFDNPQDKNDMDILIAKLDNYFNPLKNEVSERYQFFTMHKNNKSIEQYIKDLRQKAKTCNFKEMTDSFIRDKIVLDTRDGILRKKLFETVNLDLQKLVMIYNNYNINLKKMEQVIKENKTEVAHTIPQLCTIPQLTGIVMKRYCWRCGCQHPLKKCPAWGSKCTRCNDVNHFTQCCKGIKHNPKPNNNKVDEKLDDEIAFFETYLSKMKKHI